VNRPSGPGPQAGNSDNPLIEIPLSPWLAWQAARELQRAGIPYEQLPDGTIRTLEAGQPILDMIMAQHGQQRAGGLAGLDLLRRSQQNRRRAADAVGFALSLAAVGWILTQSGGWSDRLGLGGVGRGAVILIAGLVLTLFVSEIVIGARDPRRRLFVVGMMGLFAVGAMWFIGRGMGVF